MRIVLEQNDPVYWTRRAKELLQEVLEIEMSSLDRNEKIVHATRLLLMVQTYDSISSS